MKILTKTTEAVVLLLTFAIIMAIPTAMLLAILARRMDSIIMDSRY